MDRVFQDLIMLVFMHSVANWLFVYVINKIYILNLSIKNLTIITIVISVLSFGLRESIIFLDLPLGLFIPINLFITIIIVILKMKLKWQSAILGILICFATIVLWSPIASVIINQVGWTFPNDNLIQNLISAYLEMFGLILFAVYLKFTDTNIFKFLPLHKTTSGKE